MLSQDVRSPASSMGGPASSGKDVCLYFLAIFLSPLSVFIKRGCGADFWSERAT